MKKCKMILLLIFVSVKIYSQSQVNDKVYIDTEKQIVRPQYQHGYKALCDSIFNLYKSLKIKIYKDTGYFSFFELSIDHSGKISLSNCVSSEIISIKLNDTLTNWAKCINSWKPAYDKIKKKTVGNYILSIKIYINPYFNSNKISIEIVDRTLQTLYHYSRLMGKL